MYVTGSALYYIMTIIFIELYKTANRCSKAPAPPRIFAGGTPSLKYRTHLHLLLFSRYMLQGKLHGIKGVHASCEAYLGENMCLWLVLASYCSLRDFVPPVLLQLVTSKWRSPQTNLKVSRHDNLGKNTPRRSPPVTCIKEGF